jgi:hypothetical protein
MRNLPRRSARAPSPPWPIYTFLPLALLVLAADGQSSLVLGLDGRTLGDIVTVLYLGVLAYQADGHLRAMLLLIVPLSLAAEVFCSLLLGLYTYRLDTIPLYVPFGHGVIFGTGYLLDRSVVRVFRPRLTRAALLVGFAILFAQAVLVSHDTLTLVLGLLFFVLLASQRFQSFYLAMGLVVLAVELIGTHFGCWTWQAHPLGVLDAANPPVGAITFYVYGDLVVGCCYRALGRCFTRWHACGQASQWLNGAPTVRAPAA